MLAGPMRDRHPLSGVEGDAYDSGEIKSSVLMSVGK